MVKKQLRSVYRILGVLFCLSGSVQAEKYTYDEIANRIFWRDLYSQGGWSLYCGFRFDGNGRTGSGGHVRIDHIYPMTRMLKKVNCDSRQQCRESGNRLFIEMEADLHNLYPVWWEIASTNSDSSFGELPGEEWRFDNCDYERKLGVIEPRPIARGNIARAILYMHAKYGVELDRKTFVLMKKWNLEDPPSKQEKSRNNIIESIQGNRNPYIDNPKLVNLIVFKE
ncbi:MAG: endonuclease [Gammaproteobacteria bacterium]|nr:endonuclease [Gammaproteobacteria bacterium]